MSTKLKSIKERKMEKLERKNIEDAHELIMQEEKGEKKNNNIKRIIDEEKKGIKKESYYLFRGI